MGKAGHDVLRFGDAHQIEHPPRLRQRLLVAFALMQPHRLGDLFADRKHRIQRSHRLLKNHCHISAANGAHLRLPQPRQIDDGIIAPP